MDEKGQVTIEAMLIMGMFMVLLVTVSLPIVFRTKTSARDVSLVADARYVTDQIANTANSIVHPDEKRTMDMYIPGFNSPDTSIPVTIGTDGGNLVTTVALPTGNETMTIELYGSSWVMYDGSTGSQSNISEATGKRYTITLRWKNITYWRQ